MPPVEATVPTESNAGKCLRGSAVIGEVFAEPLLDQHPEGSGGKAEDETDEPEKVDEEDRD